MAPSGSESQEKNNSIVVGATKNPDGTWDYSKAMVRISENESPEEAEGREQREKIIMGKIKAQIEANPNSWVDVEQAKKYWGDIYDNARDIPKMEMQLNEIYAQKYEEMVKLARERMMALEENLNNAGSEEESKEIIKKIIEEREFAQEMEKEADARRNY